MTFFGGLELTGTSPARPAYDSSVYFFTRSETAEIYTLSLHDALPIFTGDTAALRRVRFGSAHYFQRPDRSDPVDADRKSTRLNSSHRTISYAVFCLKKKQR